MSVPNLTTVEAQIPDLEGMLLAQKKAALADPMPDRATRIRRLDKLHNVVVENRARIISACNKDFSNRAAARWNWAASRLRSSTPTIRWTKPPAVSGSAKGSTRVRSVCRPTMCYARATR